VSELLPPKARGYATTAVAGVGICGALVAVAVSKSFDWRTAYWIGGGMGLALLALRVGVLESGMFARAKTEAVSRGNFLSLFTNGRRAIRYLAVVGVGIPVWYVIGVLVRNAPDIAGDLGVSPAPERAIAVLLAYSGLAVGDFGSGFVSQLLRSRKRALSIFIALTAIGIVFYFLGAISSTWMYAAIFVMGIGAGYWAVFVTVGAEQFGTNLRATAATTAPNFVRGSLVPVTLAFQFLDEHVGLAHSAQIVGAIVMLIAFVSLFGLDETFGKDLDYVDR
jgi:putative MFS transporter